MRARAWLTLERVAVLLLVGLAASARGDVVSTQPSGGASVANANTWTAVQTFSAAPVFSAGATFSSTSAVSFTGGGSVQIRLTNRAFIGDSSGADWVLGTASNGTPDYPILGAGALANAWVLARRADFDFDFNNGPCGGAACTNPHLIVEPSAQTTTQYAAHMSAGAEFRQSKALTESAATTFVQIPVANLQAGATGGTVDYTISASDGTDTQARHGRTIFQAIAKAGTVTCTISPIAETTDGSTLAASAGTLTYGLTCATGSNLINIQANAVSSLTQTSLNIDYAVTLNGAGEIKPQ